MQESNQIISVVDIPCPEKEIPKVTYDLSIFCCGSEPRCTHIASRFSDYIQNKILIYIQEAIDDAAINNKNQFTALGITDLFSLSVNDYDSIYSILQSRLASIDKTTINIFIDYSSMPREWYAAILTYMKEYSDKDFKIYFAYSEGYYVDDWNSKECTHVSNMVNCGNVSDLGAFQEKISIIGLGLDKDAPFTISEYYELNSSYLFLANPGSNEQIADQVLKENSDYITQFGKKPLIFLPINKVAETFQCLSEFVSVLHDTTTVLLIPLGPKTHILASILVSIKYDNVPCIKIDHNHIRKYDTVPNNNIVVTKIIIK